MHSKRLIPLLQWRQATSRQFSLPPPESLALLVAGGLCGASVPGESGIRWVVYIFPPIRVLLARLGLGFFALTSVTRRRAYPGGLGFRRPVLLFLQSISGDRGGGAVSSGDGAVRYVSSNLEKSGWSLPFGVVSSLVAQRSPTRLKASDLLSLGDGLFGRSTIQVCIGFFGVPTDVVFKVYVTSSEVPSSSWESASSCSFGAPLFMRRRVERRLRWPVL